MIFPIRDKTALYTVKCPGASAGSQTDRSRGQNAEGRPGRPSCQSPSQESQVAIGGDTALEMNFWRDPQGVVPLPEWLEGPDHTHICSARAQREQLERDSLKEQDVGQAEGEAAS